jgi:hypothetical protein
MQWLSASSISSTAYDFEVCFSIIMILLKIKKIPGSNMQLPLKRA